LISKFSLVALQYYKKVLNSFHVSIWLLLILFLVVISVQRCFPPSSINQKMSLLVTGLIIMILFLILTKGTNYVRKTVLQLVIYNPLTIRKGIIPIKEISKIEVRLTNTMYGRSKGLKISLVSGEVLNMGTLLNTVDELHGLAKT